MVFVPVPGTKVQFCIWETRVQDFEAFVNATGYDATKNVFSLAPGGWVKDGHTWKDPGFEQGPTHPVTGVSWDDAKAFCAWLTEKERKEGLIQTNQSYRLPTDAEWSAAVGLAKEEGRTPTEKQVVALSAAKALARQRGRDRLLEERFGETTYPWGPKWPPPKNFGNYPENLGVDSYPFTAPVGTFPANAAGLFDLSGNVWEWCEDLNTETASYRVYRGGSFTRAQLTSFPSWARGSGEPDERFVNRGFRTILSDK
jgi:formylglycine-generating enzyme required for sulfatase activity